jgi:hypothetical protein
VDLAAYQPFVAGVAGPLREAPRAIAQDHFDRLLAARPVRKAALAALWHRHGGPAEVAALDADDAPARLGGWLAAALPALADHEGAVAALVVDVALWLGDRMIARAPQLRWQLLIEPKKATGYQRPVLVGFTRVDHDRYYVDIAHLIASWAQVAARGKPARADFLATIEAVTLADA